MQEMDDRARMVRALRALALDLEVNDGMPLPVMPRLSHHVDDPAEARDMAARFAMTDYGAGGAYRVWERRYGPLAYVIQTVRVVGEDALLAGLEKALGRALTQEEQDRALADYQPVPALPADDAALDRIGQQLAADPMRENVPASCSLCHGSGRFCEDEERFNPEECPRCEGSGVEPDEDREPSDDELCNGHGVEGGIPFSTADVRDEHDPSL